MEKDKNKIKKLRGPSVQKKPAFSGKIRVTGLNRI
jgi:hypothetical protein